MQDESCVFADTYHVCAVIISCQSFLNFLFQLFLNFAAIFIRGSLISRFFLQSRKTRN